MSYLDAESSGEKVSMRTLMLAIYAPAVSVMATTRMLVWAISVLELAKGQRQNRGSADGTRRDEVVMGDGLTWGASR